MAIGKIFLHNIDGSLLSEKKSEKEGAVVKSWDTNEGPAFAKYFDSVLCLTCDFISLKAAIDEALNKKPDNGKIYDTYPLVHGSAGQKGTNNKATVFAYRKGIDFYFIAAGDHITSSTYNLKMYYQVNSKGMRKSDIYDLTKSGDLK